MRKNNPDMVHLIYEKPVDEKEQMKEQKRRQKEREKRIKQNTKKTEQDQFDLETEMVIGMTNRNNQKKVTQKKQAMSRKQQKLERKRKKIKTILKCLTVFAIVAGGVTFAMVSPIFNVQEIEIINQKQVPAETVESLSGLTKGQNIFRFFSTQIQEKVKENPYIETVSVHRSLPNKVQIKVVEREKKFSLEFMNGYAYLSSQGYLLEIGQDSLDLPILQGAITPEEKIVPGERLEKQDLEKLETVIQILGAFQTNQLDDKVTSIDMTDKNEYSVRIEEEKKTIYLGDGTNMSNRILWVKAIIEDNKGIEGDIFVNGDLNNKFKPRFRQKV